MDPEGAGRLLGGGLPGGLLRAAGCWGRNLPSLSRERTPHLDPHVRGAWTSLGLAHGRAHLLRAAFEGVAFALREGLEALEEAGVQAPELKIAGGGALRASWRQLLADVLG